MAITTKSILKDVSLAKNTESLLDNIVDSSVLQGVKILTAGSTTLTNADSGKTIILPVAEAINIVLPTPELGMTFNFITTLTATADHAINAATDGHGFLGGVSVHSVTAGNSDHFPTATDGENDFITMNGTTTGGHAGSTLKIVAILDASAAKCWAVTGILLGSGTLATPFGDAQI
tara:strand:+ start:47 stop:574 length:528 start_codon:yes stop_codon:yes gene_type:complete